MEVKTLKIIDIETIIFKYKSQIGSDIAGHAHPSEEHDAYQSLTRIVTDEGVDGFCFGGNKKINDRIIKPALIGKNPMDREKIWQYLYRDLQGSRGLISDRQLAVIDMALWDFAGRYLNMPVYKLLGGYREKVKAYASTMVGDEIEGGLNSLEAYADFAEKLVKQGYKAIKLHTWFPPIEWAPNPEMDIAACRAVREAVGEDIALMLDCYHSYNREEALYIGRELEKLGFYWFEEPMDEHNISAYVWLAENLEIPILGPETLEGKIWTRLDWILSGAADMIRGGVMDVGGITPLMKLVHLCEAFGVRLELHGAHPGNLQVLGAMGIPGEYVERGMLHPLLDYESSTPWLKEKIDPMDGDGYVRISQKPGLGMEIDWKFIEENRVDDDK
ncbi:enolase [Candidatus Bathyarchaeota archaeon]|nr:MAG: enolase [Candidatus Bathyarchaeota archaeon]